MSNLLHCYGISDVHLQPMEKILKGCEGDLLVIAGDMTFTGSLQEMTRFKKDLLKVRGQFTSCCWVNGNHERELDPARGFSNGLNYCRELAEDIKSDFLHNSGVTYTKNGRDIKVWGSPFTPTFFDWGFLKDRGEPIAQVWKQIPEGLSLMVSHGPAHGILDRLPWSGEEVGCEELRKRLDEMESPPSVLVHGHIHCAAGSKLHRTPLGKNIQVYNVAIVNEDYKIENPPTEFYL